MPVPMAWRGEDLVLRVKVQPKASRDQVAGLMGDRLKVSLTAPPVEGAANKALIAFVAKAFKVAKGRVLLEQGESSREKRLSIQTPEPERVAQLAAAWGVTPPP